jgi:hypothetical protein
VQSLLLQRNAEAVEMIRPDIPLVGVRNPFDGVVKLPGLQGEQAHELQRVDVIGIGLQRPPAAELGIEVPAGLHVLMAGRAERRGNGSAGTLRALSGLFVGDPAFAVVHGRIS